MITIIDVRLRDIADTEDVCSCDICDDYGSVECDDCEGNGCDCGSCTSGEVCVETCGTGRVDCVEHEETRATVLGIAIRLEQRDLGREIVGRPEQYVKFAVAETWTLKS